MLWLERGGRGLVLGVSKELQWRVFIPQPALSLVKWNSIRKGGLAGEKEGGDRILVSKLTSCEA